MRGGPMRLDSAHLTYSPPTTRLQRRTAPELISWHITQNGYGAFGSGTELEMPETFMDWATIFAVPIALIGVYIGWRQLRPRKPTTTNIAVDSERVRQSGGSDETRNESHGSEDVDQSG